MLAEQILQKRSGTAPCPILAKVLSFHCLFQDFAIHKKKFISLSVTGQDWHSLLTIKQKLHRLLQSPWPLVFHLSNSHSHLLCHNIAPGDQAGRQQYKVITTRSQVSRGKEVVRPVHCVAYIYPLFFTVFMWDTGTGAPSSVVSHSGCW